MKVSRSLYATAAAGALAIAAMGATTAAQARSDVFWSVGISSPGVQLGVANAPVIQHYPQPVYVQPQPVYVQPAPVYAQPAPIYYRPAPIYVQPAPVYYQQAPVYRAGYVLPVPVYRPGFGHGHGHGYGHRQGWDRNHNGVPDRAERGHIYR
jgi:PXPV repeat (3 copies)